MYGRWIEGTYFKYTEWVCVWEREIGGVEMGDEDKKEAKIKESQSHCAMLLMACDGQAVWSTDCYV
jgi:hypothetical protein